MLQLKIRASANKNNMRIDDVEDMKEKAHGATGATNEANVSDDGTSRMRQHNAQLVANIYASIDKLYTVTANMRELYMTAAEKKNTAVDMKNKKLTSVKSLEIESDKTKLPSVRERYEDAIHKTVASHRDKSYNYAYDKMT